MKWIPVELDLPTIEQGQSREVLIHVVNRYGEEFNFVGFRSIFTHFEDKWGWNASGTIWRPKRVVAWCEIPPYSAAFTVMRKTEEINEMDSDEG